MKENEGGWTTRSGEMEEGRLLQETYDNNYRINLLLQMFGSCPDVKIFRSVTPRQQGFVHPLGRLLGNVAMLQFYLNTASED